MFHEAGTGRDYVFLANHFRLSAATIAEISKRRWQFKLFFKWNKKNLQLKSFLGTSKNALMTPIWGAPIHFLPVTYIKFLTKVSSCRTEITSRLREHLMGNSHLQELFSLDRKTLAKRRIGMRHASWSYSGNL